jgi:hypothetical protein
MFRRKIYDDLKQWKDTKAGKHALLIEGARRVGKSTIIEEFVRNEYRSYILIRFEKVGRNIKNLFEDLGDLDRFFLYLQQYTGVMLYERQSAIVFDEVQLFPLARQSIKVLLEDGRYDYYETGSLISIKKNVQNILIPSEEDTMHMYPMDFEEFLWARGEETVMPFIRKAFESQTPLGTDMHEHLIRFYRTYMIVGGMPQAIQALNDNNSFSSAEDAKRTILDLYIKDASKLDKGSDMVNVSALLRNLSSNLERHEKTFSPGSVKKGIGMRELQRSIDDLGESMMVNLCYRITEPSVDQYGHFDPSVLKIYMNDTGLLLTQSFSSSEKNKEEIYNSLLEGDLDVNEGMYFENMVAQELRMSGHGLFFSRFKHNDSEKLQEIDFIITRDGSPVPIEVKSGKRSSQHRSLDRFMDMYGSKVGRPFVIHSKDLRVGEDATYIPIYMASLL